MIDETFWPGPDELLEQCSGSVWGRMGDPPERCGYVEGHEGECEP